MGEPQDGPLLTTPLHALHGELGAKMVPFAGYDMPVQYPTGVLAEHNWTRASAGLFDVSHMGQCFLIPEDGRYETAAAALETLVPADVMALKPGQQRYSQFTNAEGGILDDLMITRLGHPGHEHWLYLVVNAACKDADYAHMRAHLPAGVTLKFMTSVDLAIDGIWAHVSRTGYTGEDGVEISVNSADAVALTRKLLADPRVKPIGLGARDSLRLEAGLCLYGHDIDTTTSPIEAGLTWSIQKRRRAEGGFLGAARIQKELAEGAPRLRVGILPDGRAPAREGTVVKSADGQPIGTVTSGGFGPTINGPLAMGYVNRRFAEPGTPVLLEVRGKDLPGKVVTMPFAPHRYVRG